MSAATALLVMVLAGCGDVSPQPTAPTPTPTRRPTATPTPDAWASLLARPVDLPALNNGDRCPTTSGSEFSSRYGVGLGDGPVYPVGFDGSGRADIVFTPSTDRYYLALSWVRSLSRYRGPALVRAHRLDGIGDVLFEGRTDTLLDALRLLDDPSLLYSTATGFGETRNVSWFSAPGCYGYQVDGIGFSMVLVVLVSAVKA